MPGLGPIGPADLLLLAIYGLLPILGVIFVAVVLWRLVRAQEAAAEALRKIANKPGRDEP
jgi:hypothetical protein